MTGEAKPEATPAERFAAIWRDQIAACRICHEDPDIGEKLHDDFVPWPGPGVLPPGGNRRIDVLLVGLEPSGGGKRTQEEVRALLDSGYRNFNNSGGDLMLQFAVEKWLLPSFGPDAGYIHTDLAKCKISVAQARSTKWERYGNCAGHLHAEVAAVQPKLIIGLGEETGRLLRLMKGSSWPPTRSITHPAWRYPPKVSRNGLPDVDPTTVKSFMAARWNYTKHTDGRGLPKYGKRFKRILAIFRKQLLAIANDPAARRPASLHADGARRG